MELFDVYKDIQTRTKGEIYIGVVGPVRTGKSTFIKRFMDLLVLPKMDDPGIREQTRDELPQSASGKTIMTTEPKFVPKEAAKITLGDDVTVKVRLIDCVGYMVNGAAGHIENGEERQVKTPWSDDEIPFTKAAGIGTEKVIRDHSTIGIVVTTDGSIGELNRPDYEAAEEKTIRELKKIGKPFLVLVNSKRPYGKEAVETSEYIREKYQVAAMPVNCEQLRQEDIHHIMEKILFAFPITEVGFYIPKWVEMLPRDHMIKENILACVREWMEHLDTIDSALAKIEIPQSPYIEEMRVEHVAMDTGCVRVQISVAESYYYEMLSAMTGMNIGGEYDLIMAMKKLSESRKEYEAVADAMQSVKMCGYGVVQP